MMRADTGHLERWIKGVYIRTPIVKFELRQVKLNGDQPVADWDFESIAEPERKEPEAISVEIYDVALEDASHFKGMTKYVVFAYKAGEQRAAFRTFIMVQGQDSDDGQIGDTEPPTKDGITSQLMRHNEAMSRTLNVATSQIISYYQRALELASRENGGLREANYKMLSDREAILSLQHERDLDMTRAMKSEERKDLLLGEAKNLVPIILSKYGAHNGDKDMEKSANETIVKNLMDSLTPEQIATIMPTLSPAQQIQIATVYEKFASKPEEPSKEPKQDKRRPTQDGTIPPSNGNTQS